MQVPSGRTLSPHDIALIRTMNEVGFIKWSDDPFTLKSGIESHVYVLGREDLTDNPAFELMCGSAIERQVRLLVREGPISLIGIPTAGTALAQAAAMASVLMGGSKRVSHRIMREVKKAHGAHKSWVNGSPRPGVTYGVIDNVVTDGGSKSEAAPKLVEDGYSLQDLFWIIFVDRQQGAVEKLHEAGFNNIYVMYKLLDITFVFQELRLWPRAAADKVEKEIRAHASVATR